MIAVVAATASELQPWLGPMGVAPPAVGESIDVGSGVLATLCGVGAARLRLPACARVLHVGFCGGLRHGLAGGDVLVVTAVSPGTFTLGGGEVPVPIALDEGTVDALRAATATLPHRMAQGAVLTVDRFVPDANEKTALGKARTYLACDMEAATVARAARQAGAVYSSLRTLSDAADEDVLDLTSPRGPAALRAARSLTRAGGTLALWRTARGYRRARRTLADAIPLGVAALQSLG